MLWCENSKSVHFKRLGLAPLAFVLLLTVSACGFKPMYGGGEDGRPSVAEQMAAIRIAPLPDRIGQQMHNLLRDRLNPYGQPDDPAYMLKVEINESRRNLGVRKDETATRANLILSATFSLNGIKGKEALLLGKATSINSFNILTNQFATSFSESHARERALREISDTIRTRLGIYFSNLPEETT